MQNFILAEFLAQFLSLSSFYFHIGKINKIIIAIFPLLAALLFENHFPDIRQYIRKNIQHDREVSS